MTARRILLLGSLVGASACANVLGLDFVPTGATAAAVEAGAADATALADGSSTGDDEGDGGVSPDGASGQLDSSTNGDSSSHDDASATTNDGSSGSATCPQTMTDGAFVVTFPLSDDLKTCVSQVGNVMASTNAVDVYSIGSEADASDAFSGIQLSLPYDYFDRSGGWTCTMHVEISNSAKGGTIGAVLVNDVASEPHLTITVQDGAGTAVIGTQGTQSDSLVDDWQSLQFYDLGFFLNPGTDFLLGTAVARGADSGASAETVEKSTPVLLRFGISGVAENDVDPALHIASITCGSPL